MNGWIRLGIVLSVVWAIAVFFYVRNQDIDRYTAAWGSLYSDCTHDNVVRKENTDCGALADGWTKAPGEGYAAFVALAPIPFGWLIVWIVFLVVRWVVRGFKRVA
jgi:hypothetical protein